MVGIAQVGGFERYVSNGAFGGVAPYERIGSLTKFGCNGGFGRFELFGGVARP
jgi:hypothetical protein